MSKPHINAKAMAMIYKTREAVEEIEKGAGEKFAKNFDINYHTESYIEDLASCEYKYQILDLSFYWCTTIQGYLYWDNIHSKLHESEEGAS